MNPHEKPILFSGAMVRAILAGKKTQTRRVVAARNSLIDGHPTSAKAWGRLELLAKGVFVDKGPSPAGNRGPYLHVPNLDGHTAHRVYPRYSIEDRLWVKETWKPCFSDGSGTMTRADCKDPTISGWKPSIFMSRARSRITLEITAVRVERLQDISAKDILAEGAVERYHHDRHLGKCPISAFDGKCYPGLRSLWGHGWESINGKGSWALNPFVWVLEFKNRHD